MDAIIHAEREPRDITSAIEKIIDRANDAQKNNWALGVSTFWGQGDDRSKKEKEARKALKLSIDWLIEALTETLDRGSRLDVSISRDYKGFISLNGVKVTKFAPGGANGLLERTSTARAAR